jgi:hypothetical protein
MKPTSNPLGNVFWGELAPCDHVMQIYTDEGVFMDTLTRFIAEGLAHGEAAVVVATAAHCSSLKARMGLMGIDVDAALLDGSLTVLDAAGTLSLFMVDGWPDAQRFHAVISGILEPLRQNRRRVRVFGEMVALLWAQGHNGATVQLEHLWNEVCASQRLTLFCAYPRIGATRELGESLSEVCALHSQVMTA